MYEMKGKTIVKKSARECAYLAVFVALLIGVQLALSALPGIEVVTVLFVAYSFVFGIKRGAAAATVFSLLRQLVFGFFPTVLVLYLVYYNLLASIFGLLGKKIKRPLRLLAVLVSVACGCTAVFTALDCLITPLWYAYSRRAAVAYAYASIPVLISQTFCTAVSVAALFFPLYKVFSYAKRGLLTEKREKRERSTKE